MSKIFFISKFFPVNLILSIFVTITKSPLSICGLKVGLFFPLKSFEMNAANLPTAIFCALITYQSFLMSFFDKWCHNDGR